MKPRLVIIAALLLISAVTYSISQNRPSVQPPRLQMMQNQGLDTAKSGLPVWVPREWGRLVSVQKLDATNYAMFLENEAGRIYIVNLIQRGPYFYLNTYDNGGTTLVIERAP
jgi:hypothetical protein